MAYFPITTCNLRLQAQNFIDLWSGISSHHRKRQRISLIPILRPKPFHSDNIFHILNSLFGTTSQVQVARSVMNVSKT